MSNGFTDWGQRWGNSQNEQNEKICYKTDVLDGSWAERTSFVDDSTQDSGDDARALVLKTTDHEEFDECWMIEDEFLEKGIDVEFVSSVISTAY